MGFRSLYHHCAFAQEWAATDALRNQCREAIEAVAAAAGITAAAAAAAAAADSRRLVVKRNRQSVSHGQRCGSWGVFRRRRSRSQGNCQPGNAAATAMRRRLQHVIRRRG